jgi:hypothetical protein
MANDFVLKQIQELERRLASLDRECSALVAQIEELKKVQQATQNTASEKPEQGGGFTQQEKISLFRSLFRGRDDVYAKRWQNQAGKAGYSLVVKMSGNMVCVKSRESNVLFASTENI